MKAKPKRDRAVVELTDGDLCETLCGGGSTVRARSPNQPVKEQAIQDLEVVKDGIKDY